MDKYSISVIVPVYNTEQYLCRCIDSLLAQTLPVRIILVDDGSSDGSGAVCDKYAKEHAEITVIHKPNGGSSSAKNAGLDAAETEFVGFVDSDDHVTNDMYEYLSGLQKKYQADVAQIEYTEADKITGSRKEKILCFETREAILRQYLEDGMKPVKSYSTCTKIYRKSLFDNVRFPEGQAYDDVTTNFDLLSGAAKYVISNKQCYFYDIRGESITQGRFKEADLDYISAGEQIAAATADDPALKRLGNMTLARFHFTCLCKILKYGSEIDFDYRKQIKDSVPVIRSGMKDLLGSGMKFGRKLVMLCVCLNTKLTIYFAGRKVAKNNTL